MLRRLVLFLGPFGRKHALFSPRASGVSALQPSRLFGASNSLLAKAKKGKAAKKSPEEHTYVLPPIEIDFDDAKTRMAAVVEKFTKHANEAKLGKTSVLVFDHLTVNTEFGPQPYTAVAQTAIKGRNFLITVFDAANSQEIINAVLGSSLNMNPQVDPASKLTLKVPLPPLTAESKRESAKQLKTVYEKFRNGPGKHSLATVRSDVRNKFTAKRKKGLTDDEAQVWKEFEALHKQYVERLSEALKGAEQVLMK